MILSIVSYAKKCKVSRQSIYNRIESGYIVCDTVTHYNKPCKVIDTSKYPITTKRLKRGKKSFVSAN